MDSFSTAAITARYFKENIPCKKGETLKSLIRRNEEKERGTKNMALFMWDVYSCLPVWKLKK